MNADQKRLVKESTDIAELIGSYRELRRSGKHYTALCPFHHDTRPSLQINTDRQTWACFVCDIHGDCFDWVMRSDGIGFVEAMKKLAERAGIVIDEDKGELKRRADQYSVMDWAASLYASSLTKECADYLAKRGISKESIEKWRIGYAPEAWGFLASKRDAGLLCEVGLCGRTDDGKFYDRFRGRLIFPCVDTQGRVIALGGRVLPGKSTFGGKYINSPESPIFRKSEYLYGLREATDEIRRSGRSIVMEGFTDVVISHQYGFKNAVACMGTAVGDWHIRRLKQLGDEIILLLDGDEAGQKRSNVIIDKMIATNAAARVATIPGGDDPADCLIGGDVDRFRKVLSAAKSPFEYKLSVLTDGFDPLKDFGRAKEAIEKIVPVIAAMPEVDKDMAIKRSSDFFGVNYHHLRNRVFESVRAKQEEPAPVKLTRKRGFDLNIVNMTFLELLVVNPVQVVNVSQDRIVLEWFHPDIQRLYLMYESRSNDGKSLDFDDVLNETDDPDMSELLVRGASVADKHRHWKRTKIEQAVNSVLETAKEACERSKGVKKKSLFA